MGLLTRVLPDQCNTLISQWKRAEQAGLKCLPVFFEMKRACYADRGPFQSLSGRRSFQKRPFATEQASLNAISLAISSPQKARIRDSSFVLEILSFMSQDPYPQFVIGQIGEILGTLKDRELQG